MRRFLFLLLTCIGCFPQIQDQTILDMSLAQAPSATPSFPNTISPPYDGDPLSATQLRVEDLTPIQNGIEAARLMVQYSKPARYQSNDGAIISVQPLGRVLLNIGGQATVLPHLTVTAVDAATAYGAALPNNTRLYLYAVNNAGSVGFQVSATPPDIGLAYKTGDEGAFFVGTFITDGVGVILPFSCSNGRYTYLAGAGQVGDVLQIAHLTTVTTTTTTLSDLQCPSFATTALIYYQASAQVSFYISGANPTATPEVFAPTIGANLTAANPTGVSGQAIVGLFPPNKVITGVSAVTGGEVYTWMGGFWY